MKKRLLISIANYGDLQLKYLKCVIDNFETYNYEISIVIDTTIDLSHIINGRQFITQRIFDCSVGQALPFKHRSYFANNIAHYDLFLYTENDHFIPQHAIDFIANTSSSLGNDEIIGFIRYEIDKGIYYLIDQDIKFPISKFHAWEENGQIFFTPFIFHSGCYLISQEQLRHAIASGGYLARAHIGPYGMLEQGASDIYTQCGFKPKFLPLPIEPVLIHHMPDKYVQMPNSVHFDVKVLSIFVRKLGDKPKLEPMYQPNILFRLYKGLRKST
jgi:hypothetical protein